jgi:hypothetical protein
VGGGGVSPAPERLSGGRPVDTMRGPATFMPWGWGNEATDPEYPAAVETAVGILRDRARQGKTIT